MRSSGPDATIHLGYEVGTGDRVAIPLAHTFVTGQTQLSGKTTTLRAIVERSGQRALAFVTKRGEDFEGRRITPYLPREGEHPIHWRLVETILASALGERKLKYERLWIINAAKGARSLQHVRDNIDRLLAKTKHQNSRSVDAYTLIREYLDLVLPDMRSLAAVDTLDLQPGLNVMDLIGVGLQLQALVIRAALEHINAHEEGVLTVFPEAWEFAPRGRSAPAKDEAIAMIRKGAVLHNFLLCDSQDIAGVDTVVRQGASVWILGVQRELNELKRTIQMIPAGIKRPKPEDVAQLELGQFYACWGRHAIKTYVQPTWMPADLAQQVARGTIDLRNASAIAAGANVMKAARAVFGEDRVGAAVASRKERTVTREEASRLTRENERLQAENADLRRRLDALEKGHHERHAHPSGREDRPGRSVQDAEATTTTGADVRPGAGGGGATRAGAEFVIEEALYQAIKARLSTDAPALLRLIVERPEIEVSIERRVIEADGSSTMGRVARLIAAEFLTDSRRFSEILRELERTGTRVNNKSLSVALKDLVVAGFLTKESVDRYRAVPEMKVRIVEAA